MGDYYAVLYTEINLFALAIILFIRYKTWGLARMVAQRNFAMCIDSQIVFFLSDNLYVLIKCGVLPGGAFSIMLTKELYFLSTTVMCFCWFLYFEYFQGSPFVENRKRMWASSVFVWIMLALLIINPFNHMLFYVDESGIYRRGPLFIVQYIVPYLYVFITCTRALIGVFDKKNISKRKTLILLSLFPVLPAGAGIVQFFYPSLPVECIVMSMSTFVMYHNWIEQMIAVDPLTRLNNRKQLVYYFDQTVKNSDDESTYLLIIDVNKFKKINDTYGHVEGDEALIRVADALRKGCKRFPYRANIARYGGDEFAILVKADNDSMLEDLKSGIREELYDLNTKANVKYELTVSIGTAKVARGVSLQELIEKADEQMYKDKKEIHEKMN